MYGNNNNNDDDDDEDNNNEKLNTTKIPLCFYPKVIKF